MKKYTFIFELSGNDYMDESGEIGANSGYAKAMQRVNIVLTIPLVF